MIICCPKTSDDLLEDVRGHGGGKINRRMLFAVLILAIALSGISGIYATSETNYLNSTTNNTTYSSLNSTSINTNNVSQTTTGSINSSSGNSTQQSSLGYDNKNNFAAGEPTTTFTIDQIKASASYVRNYIETNQKLPSYVQIGTINVTMPQFLELLSTATIQINEGNNKLIPLLDYTAPTSPLESIVSGNIPKTEYLKIANDIKNYMDTSGKTPDFAYKTSLGTYLRYENLVYMYSMIMDYYNTSGKKADFAVMKPWSVISKPVLATFTVNDIKAAATKVRNYIETNQKLPSYVQIGTINVTMPQFLELLSTATIQINEGNNKLIPLLDYTAPTSPLESIVSGNIPKTEYLKIANDIKNYMDTSGKTPDFAYKTSLGTYLRYENLVYMYSMIMDYYNTSGKKADFAVMKPWSVISKPVLATFTVNDIKAAATKVRNYIETNQKLPSYVQIGTINVTMPQFLELLSTATIQINNGNKNLIPLRNYSSPTSPLESIVSGNIPKTEYLKIANDIKNYMDTSGKTPDFAYKTSLGTYLRYENLVYMYSMIMDYYNTSGKKADFAVMKPWILVIYKLPAGFEQYIVPTNNCQSTDSRIIALANNITSGASTPYEATQRIFNWVKNNVSYQFYYNTQKGAVDTLTSSGGNCVDTTHLLIALLRSVGTPARYVHGYCQFSSGSWYGHVWANVYVNGQWIFADATSSRNQLGVINNWNTGTFTLNGYYTSLPF
ncbi:MULTISPECIES: pseudomurein-binding repeat-containing protein [Methanobacterium]|uniref:pseudomurein-binding repeat-containing protein n=1 Tax=Methanobacterium TaxID=2160 RepID=UPI000C2D2482|nr:MULTISPECIES: pseudomurein-binding repeat-containing protein [Methanobacterium]